MGRRDSLSSDQEFVALDVTAKRPTASAALSVTTMLRQRADHVEEPVTPEFTRPVRWQWSLPWAPALYVALFLLVYAPSITVPYAFADDYYVLTSYFQGWSQTTLLTITLGGRPVTALLDNLTFSYFSSLGDMRIVRLIGVIAIGLLAWELYRTLRTTRLGLGASLLIPILLCTLPPFEIYASWASASFYAIGAALTSPAALLCERAWDAWTEGRRPQAATALLGALLLQSIATAIYQPASMMFWVFAAIYLFVEHRQSLRDLVGRAALQGVVVGVGLAADLEASRLLPSLVFHSTAALARTQRVTDIPAKVSWFLRNPLVDALNLWHLTPTHAVAAAVAVILVSGLLLFVQGSWALRIAKLTLALLLIPCAYLPNLVVAENWSAYRTETGLTALIGLYVALAVVGMSRTAQRIFPSLPPHFPTVGVARVSRALGVNAMIALALTACLLATFSVTRYFVLPNYLEYQVIRSELRRIDLHSTRAIEFELSCYTDSSSPVVRYDEWGIPVSSIAWAAPDLTYVELHEIAPAYSMIPVKVIPPSQYPLTAPAHTAVLNAQLLGSYTPNTPLSPTC